jgi:hypothetical protein
MNRPHQKSIPEERDEPGTSAQSEKRILPGANVARRREASFLLMVTGQIEAVELISVPNVYCKFCYVFGPDWRQVGGMEEG